jgi:hypothetical protein
MKLQTGMRVDAELWGAYRKLCSSEKQRPSHPVEEFLRLAVDNDSTMGLLGMMRETARSRVEGCNAHARVLLDWYTHNKFWIKSRDEDLSVEELLLEDLKMVADANLRSQIEEAFISRQRRICEEEDKKL